MRAGYRHGWLPSGRGVAEPPRAASARQCKCVWLKRAKDAFAAKASSVDQVKLQGVPRAEFEEKEFEQAAVVELAEDAAGERGLIMSSGQVLEEILGYDAAAAPARRNLIWRIPGDSSTSRPPPAPRDVGAKEKAAA